MSGAPTPFELLGGEQATLALAESFYDAMDANEPELARLHELDADGKVARGPRDRFALFLVEWLGGPRVYSPVYGHPRLRMRHAHAPIDTAMRDAWLRAMFAALDARCVEGPVRAFLETRFAEVADFLRNRPG